MLSELAFKIIYFLNINSEVPMRENSTLFYSIHNLASKAQHEIIGSSILESQQEQFQDVIKLLNIPPKATVKQKVIDNIMKFADSYK